MKINKGMYIRFKNNKGIQYIGKLININEYREPCFKYAVEVNWYDDYIFIGDDDILKASFNLIDLIKVGDYVNGEKVCSIISKDKDYCYFMKNSNKYFDNKDIIAGCDAYSYQKPITDIVTKEQFNSMKYVVERDK